MPHKPDLTCRRQCAALPLSDDGGEPRVMLVTSRETRRWVLPKGWVEKRVSAAEQAAQEAYEEAGIRGPISHAPVGTYTYRKRLASGACVPCEVEVYPMQVEALLEDWPEKDQRERRWFTLAEAAAAVEEDGLARLLRRIMAAPSAA